MHGIFPEDVLPAFPVPCFPEPEGSLGKSLLDAIWRCREMMRAREIQTDANICAEVQCRAWVAEVLEGTKKKVQRCSRVESKFRVQQRDDITAELESKLRSLISSPSVSRDAASSDVSRSQKTAYSQPGGVTSDSGATQGGAQPKRMALTQQRREERSRSETELLTTIPGVQ